MKSRNLVVGAVAAGLALLLGLAGLAVLEVRRYEADTGWVEHTHAVMDELHDARLYIKNIEIGRREFLLTKSATARETVQSAAESLRWIAESLQKTTFDNPPQAARAEELAVTAADIRASIEGRFQRGSAVEGAAANAHAEQLAQEMMNEERRLLIERMLRQGRSAALVSMLLSFGFVLAALGAGLMLAAILRGRRERTDLVAEFEKLKNPPLTNK